jgi:Mg2+-importing ATPase
MIRTAKIPFVQSRASWPVLITTAVVMTVGIGIAMLPIGAKLGFEAPPPLYLVFVSIILLAYMLLTQIVKRWYIRKFASWL